MSAMLDSSLRRAKDRLGEPLAVRLPHLSPNIISLTAFGAGILTALFIARGFYFWALVLWLLSRALDGLDGLLARVHQKQSDFGGYLDILLDFCIYAVVPIAFVLSTPSYERYLALAFMLSTFYLNSASWMYLAAILEKHHTHRAEDTAASRALTTVAMPDGLIGGTETILTYCAFFLWTDQLTILFVGFGVLVLFTAAQRLAWAWRNLR